MVSNKKTVKRFKHSGKRQTKRYTDCVKYVQSKGAEVDEPEVEEVFLEKKEKEPEIIEEPEPVPEEEEEEPEPVEEEEPEPEVEEEEEEETVPSTNDFRFEEPENFKVQTEYLEGERVVVDDPLSLQNARADEALKVAANPKPEMKMEVEMEMEVPVKETKSKNKPKSKKRGNKKKGKSSKKRKH